MAEATMDAWSTRAHTHPAAAPTGGGALAGDPVTLTIHHARADGTPAQLVLFKRTVGAPCAPLAWKVVQCAPGQRVHASYPFSHDIGVIDHQGRHAGLTLARPGARLLVGDGAGGPILQGWVEGAAPSQWVGLRNASTTTMIDAVLYKDGRPLSRFNGLTPGAGVEFDVLPFLYAAVLPAGAPRLAEGDQLDTAMIEGATRISLLGLRSADLLLADRGAVPALLLRNQRFS